MTEASMKSGQKARTRGVTVYTEQPIYMFYENYRIAFLSMCLTEASAHPQYAGEVPQHVSSEHEGNLWAAVWTSRQAGFDMLEYCAKLQEELNQTRLKYGYGHVIAQGLDQDSTESNLGGCSGAPSDDAPCSESPTSTPIKRPRPCSESSSPSADEDESSDADAQCKHVRGSQDESSPSSDSVSDTSKSVASTQSSKGRVGTQAAKKAFDPKNWRLIPRAYNTLMGYLKYCSHETLPGVGEMYNFPKKWRGVNVLPTTDPKYCPICENGVKHELRLKKLRKIYIDNGTFEMLRVHTEILFLERKMKDLATHRTSLEVQKEYRKALERQCHEDKTMCVVTTDFVSFFARDGTKVRDLVFVVYSHLGIMYIHCINWGNTAGCDTHFVADGVRHILLGTSIFKDMKTIHFISDRAACYKSPRTYYILTSLWGLLNILLKVVLDSDMAWDHSTEYHGAGRADGAGAAIKALYFIWSLWARISGDGPTFVQACNSGEVRKLCKKTGFRSVVLNFGKVNYGSKVFEAVTGPPGSTAKNQNDIKALWTAGSIATSWMQDGVLTRMVGVICVRQFSGQGEWTFVDVTHSAHNGRGRMCPGCTRENARPVYHGTQPCTMQAGTNKSGKPGLEEPVVPQPDESRLDGCGKQQSKKPAVARSRGVLKDVESKMTVAVLKAFLKAQGKSSHGNRDALLARAKSCDGWEQKDAGEEPSEGEDNEKSEEEGDWLAGEDAACGEGSEDGEKSEEEGDWIAVESIVKRKNGDPEPLYFFKWLNEKNGSWETASSWMEREGLDLAKGLNEEEVGERIRVLESEVECEYAVEAVTRRRVVVGGRGGPQVQYQFKWVNESAKTWETALSWAGRYGQLMFEGEGIMSMEQVKERIQELDKELDKAAGTKSRKRTRGG
jgi:hypothetical protein